MKYFIDSKIDQQKIIAKGFGEAASGHSINSQEQRRVEINIFELKK